LPNIIKQTPSQELATCSGTEYPLLGVCFMIDYRQEDWVLVGIKKPYLAFV